MNAKRRQTDGWWTDTAIETIPLLSGWGRRACSWNGWLGGCMLPGHSALYYYLWNGGKVGLGQRCLHGIAPVCPMYLWTKTRNLQSTISLVFMAVVSRSAIHDDPGAGSWFTIHDPKIVTSLIVPFQPITMATSSTCWDSWRLPARWSFEKSCEESDGTGVSPHTHSKTKFHLVAWQPAGTTFDQ